MRPGDKVCLRDDPSIKGTICRLAGHKAVVRWSAHTTTTTSRHALQLEPFEDREPITQPAQMMHLSERLSALRKHQAAMNVDSPQLSKGETHNG